VQQRALPHGRLTQRNNRIILVLAYGWIVVVVRALLWIIASIWIIFELDFIVLQETIPSILLSVRAHLTHKLLFQCHEILATVLLIA